MTAADLPKEAERLHPIIEACYLDYCAQRLRDYDLVGIYILLFLAIRRPNAWAGGRLGPLVEAQEEAPLPPSSPLVAYEQVVEVLGQKYVTKAMKVPESRLPSITVMDIFRSLRFVGIKANGDNYVNRAIVLWSVGKRPIRLLSYIPSPMEVLRQQAAGERVVTIFTTLNELGRQHTSKLTYMESMPEHDRDALEFTIHDLKHMELFAREDIFAEQVGFFRCMLAIDAESNPRNYFRARGHDQQLWNELEYVISDMNCHCTHLLRYLYAKLLQSCHRNASSILSAYAQRFGATVDPKSLQEYTWHELLCHLGMRPASAAAGPEEDSSASSLTAAAFAAAKKLLDLTAQEGGLSVEEWETIRDFFRAR